ncbi:hypothetical protein ACJRO7_030770 [Eucalyptus globulus]|uniref:WAT1-related protein n=1 Tax=Eucalyptus globulus TaxID=34317 RepID=A0ABD3JCN9_EUCGL
MHANRCFSAHLSLNSNIQERGGERDREREREILANFDPMTFLVIVQVGCVAMSFISNPAMDDGLNLFVLLTHCQIIATIATTPFAFLMERKTGPKITMPILFHIVLLTPKFWQPAYLFTFMDQVFLFMGLNNSSVKLSLKFSASYTTTILMYLMASIECSIIGVATRHTITAKPLTSGIRFIAVFNACVHKEGPLYNCVFSTLLLVMLTQLRWALLREKLYLGILAGVVFIIFGLYSVLWGKGKEVEQARITDEVEAATKYCEKEDSESWLHLHVNGKSRQDPN